ncbi:alginate export family protein [Rhizorhapis suberifaciens]|uniref:Alginate export domain-containing protein n=1 Tax=Rhizorhapis suberifaciens TaxID=13656 RepID=A0A840HTG0_9SPHN|nr:alginate export family protein [Rhizorhapis suberifaciens]MBB4640899.1 hypothetical protein [Rhizorhapis suberifaciens]
MKKYLLGTALLAVVSTPAMADTFKLKPLIDMRLRYENVDQDGFTEDADAVTVRTRAGAELANKSWSFLVEAEGTLAINEDYNSGVNGKASFPVVADPENIELNRAQVQFKGLPKTVVTVGRQRINLDDQRFVGSVGWRDNEQTFDAVRVEWTGIKNLKLDATYAWSDRTIWGIDGTLATTPPRPQAVEGDNVFANLTYTTKLGALTGFYYRVDEDEAAVALLRNSSQTYGARFAGALPFSKAVKLTYAASYAHQTDIDTNPINYSTDYYMGEAGIEAGPIKLLGGVEVLGSDGSVATKATGAAFAGGFAFQTPFATLHKFQGWADKFLVTPAQGITDYYGTIGYSVKKKGPFDVIGLTATYHRFDSDRLDINYGDEIDVQLLAKVKKYTFTLKYADYQREGISSFTGDADTKKFWASVEWAF